jgi:hypothetical protein
MAYGTHRDIKVKNTLGVAGATTLSSTLDVTGATSITGATTLQGKLMTGSPVQSAEVTFTETAGAGTYTGSVTLPAGATLLNIVVYASALWDNSGAVSMIVGDADDDNGYYVATDLKATDLLAQETLSFSHPGGKGGAYLAGTATHWTDLYYASGGVITGKITAASTGGSAGRTRMTVVWSQPAASHITAATKA